MTKKKKNTPAASVSELNVINIPGSELKRPEIEIVSKECWFFSQENDRLRYGDNRLCEVGVTHTTENKTKLCEHGLHGSPTVWYAMNYAPGDNLWRVKIDGIEQYKDEGLYLFGREDKWVGTSRTYIAKVNARDILFEYTRKEVLKSVENHIGNGMQFNPLILEYLKGGEVTTQYALDNMIAIDLSDKKERACYDLVFNLISIHREKFCIAQRCRNLLGWIDGRQSMYEFYFPKMEAHKELDEHFMKEMQLAVEAV